MAYRPKQKTTAPVQPAVISPEDLALTIGFHPETVRRALRGGRIHAIQIGRRWRISQAEVARIISTGL